jgi:rhodanese-related sulfurtransferase
MMKERHGALYNPTKSADVVKEEVSMSEKAYAGDVTPTQAWEILEKDPKAVLVDVRTQAEWGYVGIPDLSRIGKRPLFASWALFPNMEINDRFADEVVAAGIKPDAPVLFLCRSGVRSRSAAIAVSARGYTSCYNVASGFEGDPDARKHRGTINGWKVEGLPWIQG